MRPALLAVLLLASPAAAQTPAPPSLIPWPASYRPDSGRWMPGRAVVVSGPVAPTAESRRLAALTRQVLQESFGVPARTAGTRQRADVTVRIRPGPDSLRESYELVVTPRGVSITAGGG